MPRSFMGVMNSTTRTRNTMAFDQGAGSRRMGRRAEEECVPEWYARRQCREPSTGDSEPDSYCVKRS